MVIKHAEKKVKIISMWGNLWNPLSQWFEKEREISLYNKGDNGTIFLIDNSQRLNPVTSPTILWSIYHMTSA